MKILLAHRRFPGPFRLLARRLLAEPGVAVAAVAESAGFAEAERRSLRGLTYIVYDGAQAEAAEPNAVRHALDVETAHGNGIAKAAEKLRDDGWVPDVVVAASAGGAALFLRPALPDARHLHYLTAPGPTPCGIPPSADPRRAEQLAHLAFVTPLAGLHHADGLVLPSAWDLAQFPPAVAPLATVIPDAVDSAEIAAARPRPIRLPGGTTVAPGDELVTVSAAPADAGRRAVLAGMLLRLAAARPDAQILLLRLDAATEALFASLRGAPHAERIQAAGSLDRPTLLAVLKGAAVHLQLEPRGEAPSLAEAMAAGCPLVVADSGGARDMVDGRTGRLADPSDGAALLAPLLALLDDRATAARLGKAAAARARRHYDFDGVAWPAWRRLLDLPGAAS